jgi:hypothetical protein
MLADLCINLGNALKKIIGTAISNQNPSLCAVISLLTNPDKKTVKENAAHRKLRGKGLIGMFHMGIFHLLQPDIVRRHIKLVPIIKKRRIEIAGSKGASKVPKFVRDAPPNRKASRTTMSIRLLLNWSMIVDRLMSIWVV